MSVRFRSPFDEERVCPWLDYIVVEPGGTITVPDEQWPNWVAGGWEPLDPDPATPPPPPATPPPSVSTTGTPAPSPVTPAPPATSAGSDA